MSVEKEIRGIEKRIISEYTSDGILDFLMGISFIGVALLMLAGYNSLVAIALTPIIFMRAMRKKYTYPRLGYADPEKIGNASLQAFFVLGLLVITIGLILWGVIAHKHQTVPLSIDPFLMIFAAILVGGYLSSVALITKVTRFYLYAVLIGGLFLFGHFVQMKVAFYVLLMGFFAFTVGSFLFIGFTRKYPIIEDEDHDTPES